VSQVTTYIIYVLACFGAVGLIATGALIVVVWRAIAKA
jgi:hypothetical protein